VHTKGARRASQDDEDGESKSTVKTNPFSSLNTPANSRTYIAGSVMLGKLVQETYQTIAVHRCQMHMELLLLGNVPPHTHSSRNGRKEKADVLLEKLSTLGRCERSPYDSTPKYGNQ
jgi:hypothetical protein